MDSFDPRGWEIDDVRTITLDRNGDVFALVSLEDYQWAIDNGPWHLWSARGRCYARKQIRGPGGERIAFYLHRLIMLRSGIKPPTRQHTVVDHENGDGLRNTRANLRWSTISQNALNHNNINRKQLRLWNGDDIG